jgi:hypothetical protein
MTALAAPAVAELPSYPKDPISTNDDNRKIDHNKDAAWTKTVEAAKSFAHDRGWPGEQRERDKQAEASPLPDAKPTCEFSIKYKIYAAGVRGGPELPWLAFVIWTVEERTGKTLNRNTCRANSAANLLTCIDFDTGWKWLAKAYVWGVGPHGDGEWRSINNGDSMQIKGDD